MSLAHPYHRRADALQEWGWAASILVAVVSILSVVYYAGRVTERVDAITTAHATLRAEFVDTIKQNNAELRGIHSEIKDLTAYTSNIAGKLGVPPQRMGSLSVVPETN